jgi:hypothetical protein
MCKCYRCDCETEENEIKLLNIKFNVCRDCLIQIEYLILLNIKEYKRILKG